MSSCCNSKVKHSFKFNRFLFQINSLIAQLADANRDTLDNQECNALKEENEKLKRQISEILVGFVLYFLLV